MTTKIDAKDIKEFLGQHYGTEPFRWVYFSELRPGTGQGHDVEKYIDGWAMACAQSQNWEKHAYEIKVSRSDWLSELKKPLKRRMGMMLSNEFYFIAPKGIIKMDEVPAHCGLIEVLWVTKDTWFDTCKETYGKAVYPMFPCEGRSNIKIEGPFLIGVQVIPAPWRDIPPPSWKLFASTMRRLVNRPEKGSIAVMAQLVKMVDRAIDLMPKGTNSYAIKQFKEEWKKFQKEM